MEKQKTKLKYQLIPWESDRYAVKVTGGRYKGIVFLPGKVQFQENDSQETATFRFDYNIIENPKKCEVDKRMESFIGDVIIELLDKELEREDNERIELDGGETNTEQHSS